MMKMKQMAFTALLAAGLSTQAAAGSYNSANLAFDDSDTLGLEMAADAFIVRPLTLGYSALGLLGWVLSLPVSIPGGNSEEVADAWVVGPLRYTFLRPVGEMEEGAKPNYVQNPINWE